MPPSQGPIERAIALALRARSRRTASAPNENRREEEPATRRTSNLPSTPSSSNQEPFANNRRKHHVAKLRDRYTVVSWMLEQAAETGADNIASRAVRQFPQHFPGNTKANLQKASNWWRSRDTTMNLKEHKQRRGSFSSTTSGGIRRAEFKSLKGRGRKRATWVSALYCELRSEFERLRALGVKFSCGVLRTHARLLIERAPLESDFHAGVTQNGINILRKISYRWTQHFMHSNGIVIRAQTGTLLTSPANLQYIERAVAHHLGELKRGFEGGRLNENYVENADETHFVFNMDDGRTLGFRGDNSVKYADVVSGGEAITMMVRLTGGVNARIETPMLIFKNVKRSYPIQGVPDNVPGVCYRTGPKAWMDGKVFKAWLSEPRAIKPLPFEQMRILFIDNCSGHVIDSETREELRRIRTKIRKLPPNATHLIQPADSFVIQKIKDAWRARWEEYKYSCIKDGLWTAGSGKLPNPGKPFFLKLAASCVRDVNEQRDRNGLSYARKAMIRTGMSLNVNGLWQESQLADDLQHIIARNRPYFDGTLTLPAPDIETESESEEHSGSSH